MLRLCCCLALALTVAGPVAAAAAAAELVVVVDTGTSMPAARFVDGVLVDGWHRDIGQALAQRLGRAAVFVGLPRRRLAEALAEGKADIACTYMPDWLPGPFDWSTGFAPTVEVLIADRRAPRPRRVQDVAGKRVGTVLGYVNELALILGKDFVPEDAPSAEANLRKMAVGRMQYALTTKAYIEYRMKQGDLPLALHPPLEIKTLMTQCAVSRKGRVRVDEINGAIARMARDRAMEHIIDRYR